MNCEFMIASTPLPPCMPLPKAMLRLPVSNTAKVMYARLLDEILTRGTEDSNGILFIRFPVIEIAAALSRSPQTCKRSLNELEQAGMIMRVRQGIGEVSHIYILLPKEGAAHEPSHQVLSSLSQLVYKMYYFIGEDTKPQNVNMLNPHKAIMGQSPKFTPFSFPLSESKYYKLILL